MHNYPYIFPPIKNTPKCPPCKPPRNDRWIHVWVQTSGIDEAIMKGKPMDNESKHVTVGDVLRLPDNEGGYRVWQVIGCHYGAMNQEDVIALMVLDQSPPPDDNGIIRVPVSILKASGLERIRAS